MSLAHHGVLFLDELPLYRGEVLESLRVPLEAGRVRIARSAGAVSYPARFSLIATMNPCVRPVSPVTNDSAAASVRADRSADHMSAQAAVRSREVEKG